MGETEPRLVIDVIDNGGQWTHREWRMLRYLGVDTKILPNDTPLNDLRDLDGLIQSIDSIYDISLNLSNNNMWPNWYEDNEFRSIRDSSLKLYDN